jgi:membrane-associated protease RseP (regulator of RpoE activity)
MTTLTDCPQSNWGQWNFRIFGIPVHVKVWFWAAIVLLSGFEDDASVIIWVVVCFLSILVHEMGHVAAYRLFGGDGEIVLYAFGGLAVGTGRWRTATEQAVVSLAGPLAGFCLAGLIWWAATQTGSQVVFGFHLFLPTLHAMPRAMDNFTQGSYRWYIVLNDLLLVNFYWGLVNLLPVYPLDGGQAARAVFENRGGKSGLRLSLMLSVAVAAAAALLALANRSLYLLIFFLILAIASMQSLERAGGWSWRGTGGANRSWR